MVIPAHAWPLGPVFGIQKVSAESLAELFGVSALGEAENDDVLVIAVQRVGARAERQSFALAEEADRKVAVAHAAVGRQHHLVRQLRFQHCSAELAFTTNHRRPAVVAARARRYL